MRLFIIITCFLLGKTVFSKGHPKCCKSGEYLKIIDSHYRCTENVSKRLDVLTNETNFLGRGTNGECVDITSEFSIFEIKSGEIVGERLFEGSYFPKCCPLNYTYNSVLHSCEERENVTHSYIRENFIKVGLLDCRVIVDIPLTEDTDIYGSIIDIKRHSRYCIDNSERGSFIMRECRKDIEVCDNIRCVKKCCPDGQSFVNGRHCLDTYTNGLDLKASPVVQNPHEPFAVITNITCKRIFVMSEKRYIFNLTKNGVFQYWSNYSNSFISEYVDQRNSYCFEHSSSKKANGFFFFKCRPENPVQKRFIYPLVPKILSCVFLILTIFIYFFLGETRSLFGKILINYCISTLFLFSLLSYVHRQLAPGDATCKFIAYALIYSSTASFAWLNLMCCDIWWTFGTSKQIRQQRKDLKKLLCYLLYGWGMPTLLTSLIFLFSQTETLPYVIHPFVGGFICFIEKRPNNYGAILFLRFPHLVIQLVNTVLFVKTIVYCLRIKNEINKINDTTKSEKKSSFKKDKERLSLILKLAVIMGVTYIFDVMSAFVTMNEMGVIPEYIEIIWDCINCSQGIFIFIIFIFKKRIYRDFMKKLKLTSTNNAGNNSPTSTTVPMITVNSKSVRVW